MRREWEVFYAAGGGKVRRARIKGGGADLRLALSDLTRRGRRVIDVREREAVKGQGG